MAAQIEADSAAIKVYLCTVPCDMRRSFDGLSMMAEHIIGCNPFSGHLLVFSNRRRCALQDRKTCPLSGSHNN
ncbi:MAG: IS66 family insertion sequence element accessory protein TnpB, partial [Acidobacteriota bacterium]